MATWATCGQRGYITLAVSKVPNGQQGVPKQKWLPGPHVSKVATSPLGSWGSRNPPHGDENQQWLPGTHVGKLATSPLRSWGSPTLNAGEKNRNGHLAQMWARWLHHPCGLGGAQRSTRGEKMEIAAWPRCGQSGYITPAVLGVLNARRGDNKQKWLHGPHMGKLTTSPLPCWRSPTLHARTKNRNGYLGRMWAKRLHHPCHLEGPQW